MHRVKNKRISPEPIQAAPEKVWADFAPRVGKSKQEEYPEIFRKPQPGKIIINPNRKVNRSIRFFSDDKQILDPTDDWDPMRLADIFGAATATDKDVLETLDDLRDRLR